MTLDGEEAHDHADGQRHDQRLEGGRGDVQAFDGAQDGDGGRQQAVAVEQRGTGDGQHEEEAAAAFGDSGLPRHQGHEGEDAAFAAVVGAHHDKDVLQGDDDDQRPGDQRQDPEHVVGGRLDPGEFAEALLHRVERAGADVAVHDAKGRERQGGRPARTTGRRRRTIAGHAGTIEPLEDEARDIAPPPRPVNRCGMTNSPVGRDFSLTH